MVKTHDVWKLQQVAIGDYMRKIRFKITVQNLKTIPPKAFSLECTNVHIAQIFLLYRTGQLIWFGVALTKAL